MKRIAVTVALPLLAALATMAQSPAGQKSGQASKQASPVVKCKGPDGTACTARQVQALSDAVFEAKRQHEALLPVKDLTLASSDGTLQCVQNDGTACATAQLDAVKEIAAGQQLFINYNTAKPNARK
jgi:hypothetical protein